MSDNIRLEIKEKTVSFNPVVTVRTIEAANNGTKVNSQPKIKKAFIPVKPRRFGMQFVR